MLVGVACLAHRPSFYKSAEASGDPDYVGALHQWDANMGHILDVLKQHGVYNGACGAMARGTRPAVFGRDFTLGTRPNAVEPTKFGRDRQHNKPKVVCSNACAFVCNICTKHRHANLGDERQRATLQQQPGRLLQVSCLADASPSGAAWPAPDRPLWSSSRSRGLRLVCGGVQRPCS